MDAIRRQELVDPGRTLAARSGVRAAGWRPTVGDSIRVGAAVELYAIPTGSAISRDAPVARSGPGSQARRVPNLRLEHPALPPVSSCGSRHPSRPLHGAPA